MRLITVLALALSTVACSVTSVPTSPNAVQATIDRVAWGVTAPGCSPNQPTPDMSRYAYTYAYREAYTLRLDYRRVDAAGTLTATFHAVNDSWQLCEWETR